MVNDFFKGLSDHIAINCPFIERVGKNVNYIQGEKGFVIPVQCFDEDCNESKTYLLPQKSVDSLLFFELNSSVKEVDDSCHKVYRLNFNVFFWYNCEKIEIIVDGQEKKCCDKIDYLHREIIKCINSYKNSVYNSTEFSISRRYINDDLNYHPYYNFFLNFDVRVDFNPCEKNEEIIEINAKEC